MDSSLINETSYELLQSTLSGIKKEVEELQNQIHQQHLEIEQSEEARLNFWLLIAATNILLMQAGFALLEVGTVQAKNAKSILFKNLVDCCTGVIIWWLFGYAISQGGFTEPKPSNFGNLVPEEAVYFFHSFTYSTTCATIISGGVAERISFAAYMALAGTMVGLFYPLMAYWCWGAHGFLYELGYTDFAGSGVIHALGGIATLVSAWMLGPRIGRFNVDVEKGQVEVHEFKGHSPVLSALGTFILLFGWFSFNASSTLGADVDHFMLSSRAAVNTMLAAAAASLTGIVWRQKETGVHDLAAVNNTLLCGAVSITGCCAYVDFWVAPIIGALSTVGYYCASTLSMSFKIDDPLDAFAVHGGGGIWGVIATGLLANPKYLDEGRGGGLLFGSGLHMFGAQLLGLLMMIVWGGLAFALVLFFLDKVPGFKLRADKDAELLGLDFAYHDGYAYPDFNKQNILTFNEMKAAEKRVEARNKGRKRDVKKVADFTAARKRKNKKNHDGSSFSGSSCSGSTSNRETMSCSTQSESIPSHSTHSAALRLSRMSINKSQTPPIVLDKDVETKEELEKQLFSPFFPHQREVDNLDKLLKVNETSSDAILPRPSTPNEKAKLISPGSTPFALSLNTPTSSLQTAQQQPQSSPSLSCKSGEKQPPQPSVNLGQKGINGS